MSQPPRSQAAAAAARSRDHQLVQRVLDGEPSALEELTRRLLVVPRLTCVLNKERGSPLSTHDLEDLSQDILTRVWGKLNRYEGRASLEHWVYPFCRLEFMNRLRKLGSSRMRESTDIEEPAQTLRPGAALEAAEIYERLAELDPEESRVLELKHLEDLSFSAIGTRLGIPTNTAKTRYYRGITKLRQKLKAVSPGGDA